MKTLLLLFTAFFLFFSCKKDQNEPIVPEPSPTLYSFTGEMRTNDNSTITSADNNLLICGYVPSHIFVLKISNTGSQIWRKEFYAGNFNFPSGIAQSGNQDIFVCGYTYKNENTSKADVLLMKLNSNGDTLWTKTYGGSEDDYGYYIITTQDGNLLICGTSSSSTDGGYSDIYLVKVNLDGDTLWTKTFLEENKEIPYHVMQTQNGEFLVTGAKEDTTFIRELYFLKVSSEGTPVWNKVIGTAFRKSGFSTLELSNGDLMTCGQISKIGDNQLLLVRTDSQGNEEWEKEYGDDHLSEQGTAIRFNEDSTFIVTGTSSSSHSGQQQIVLLKINPNGDLLFLKKFGESATSSGQNILKDVNDDNLITGNYNFNLFMTTTDNNGVFK